ncbi:MAG: putative rane protein [Gemmatimonadetes bacterium]|nr:putative rane protein [Gemmatimonadota bacterium]
MIPLKKPPPRLLRWLGPAAVLMMMLGALWLLHRQLAHYDFREVKAAVVGIPHHRLVLALALTVVSYALLPGYDFTALAYVKKKLPWHRVELAGFLAYGISQTLGFPLVTGSGIRYRLWSSWGLSTAEIAEAIAFANATHTVCAGAVIGTALLLEPRYAVELLKLPAGPLRPVGALCVIGVVFYLVWSVIKRGKPLRFRGWEFPVPPVELTLVQLAVAAGDWVLAGTVLYVMLPTGHGITFPIFIGAFLISLFAGLISHVPGGVGVFETLMVLLLEAWIPAPEVLGRLVAYRALYYLVPFFVAVVLLGIYEIRRQGKRLAAAATISARWVPSIVPQVLGVTTFVGGAVLLLSGSTPSEHGRVRAVTALLPLGVVELSHFAASLAGAGLVVLAWGLSRRLDAAWGMTVAVLLVGIVASLLRGFEWEEAIVLTVMLGLLLPSRRAFYRKTTLLSEPFTPEWVVAVVLAVGSSLWLGFFAYRHVQFSDALWWRFSVTGDAPRFMRASVGVLAMVAVFALVRLFRHAEPEPHLPTTRELERARRVAGLSPEARAARALRGDLDLLFSRDGAAMLAYGVERKTWVAVGDPVGPPADRAEVAWTFWEEANLHRATPVFHEVGAEELSVYQDLGLTLLKVGEEALLPLAEFALDAPGREELRRMHGGLLARGAAFRVEDGGPPALDGAPAATPKWFTELAGAPSDAPPAEPVPAPRCATVQVEGRTVAVGTLFTTADDAELAVDELRLSPGAPAGTAEFLFAEVALWARAQGFRRFSLGSAPLEGPPDRTLGPVWAAAGPHLFPHGEHFPDSAAVRAFKQRFAPVWEPRYLASPGGLALPRILTDVATLMTRGAASTIAPPEATAA